WIASPYFVPEHSVIVALQLAGLRGVDVRILIPDKPDHLTVYLAAYSYFDDAGQTGAKFYRYQHGFLHEKAMLIDDTVATIGTANFDNRSFRLNFEITAAIADPTFLPPQLRDHRGHCRPHFRHQGRAHVPRRLRPIAPHGRRRVRQKAMVLPPGRPHRPANRPHPVTRGQTTSPLKRKSRLFRAGNRCRTL
ncbi:MAG: hypothetical protein JRG93_21725, partial [Deltaproteobacteria bacterium]|nr:hypothetical protein [Deltaproteobacteria bacterium]